ncbi:HAD family hydrolase, partial [Enterococcus faecium]
MFAKQEITLTQKNKTSYKVLNHHLGRDLKKGRLPGKKKKGSCFGLFSQQLGKKEDSKKRKNRYRHYLNQGHDLVPGSLEILKKVHPHADLY